MKQSGPFLPGQLRLILATGLVYILAWFAYFSRIPAGIYLGPEGIEALDQAMALAQGQSSGGGGYSLYVFLLSLLARLFDDGQSLTLAARGLNGIALLAATGLTASAAGHYWRRNRAVWIAGILIALNPVLVFWAGEVTPCALATAFVAASVWRIMPWLRGPRTRQTLWIGALPALAACFETTLVPFVLAWPALAFFYTSRRRTAHLLYAVSFPLTVGGLLLISNTQLQSPLNMSFGDFGVGLYDALANHEAYDGKSFGLYRQLHALLLVNPVHWGALFILTCGGFYVRLKDGHQGNSVYFCIAALCLFTVSYAALGGASQSRASMIPLLAVFASGVGLLPKIWRHAGQTTRRKIMTGLGLLVAFVYSTHLGWREHKSRESDYVFLAETNVALGNNDRATTWAEKALDLNPANEGMRKVPVMAEFNEWAVGDPIRTLPIETARTYLERTYGSPPSTEVEVIRGIYYFKLRETETATALWLANSETSPLARVCLYWTAIQPKPTRSELAAYKGMPYFDVLDRALQISRSDMIYHNIEKLVDNMLAFAY